MARKNANNYFDMLVDMERYSCKAAASLRETLENFQFDQADERMQKLHEIEHGGDMAKHEMIHKLQKEFITPIEREVSCFYPRKSIR